MRSVESEPDPVEVFLNRFRRAAGDMLVVGEGVLRSWGCWACSC